MIAHIWDENSPRYHPLFMYCYMTLCLDNGQIREILLQIIIQTSSSRVKFSDVPMSRKLAADDFLSLRHFTLPTMHDHCFFYNCLHFRKYLVSCQAAFLNPYRFVICKSVEFNLAK